MTQHDTAAAKAHTAPPPDADRKPDSPGDIDRPGWRYTAKASVAEFQRDQCTDLAALAIRIFGPNACHTYITPIQCFLFVFCRIVHHIYALSLRGESHDSGCRSVFKIEGQ